MGVCRSTDQSADLLSKAEGKMNAARSSEHKSEMGSWMGKKRFVERKFFLCCWKKLMFGWLEREMHGVALVRGDVIIPSVFLPSQDIPEIHDDGCID